MTRISAGAAFSAPISNAQAGGAGVAAWANSAMREMTNDLHAIPHSGTPISASIERLKDLLLGPGHDSSLLAQEAMGHPALADLYQRS